MKFNSIQNFELYFIPKHLYHGPKAALVELDCVHFIFPEHIYPL